MFRLSINSVILSKINQKSIFKKAYWLLLLGSAFSFNTESALSQIIISKNNINQLLTVEGTSGGSISALEITQTKNTATGYCDGFASLQPNHILNIESFFQSLRLEVKSDADTTIIIKGPGGVWCNDDTNNTNPMIQGAWQSGVYKVWVGSYQADAHDTYQITMTGRE